MATVFLNGRFISQDDARISAFDAGFQHGVGLFETMLGGTSGDGPWALLLDAHIDRLITSARDLGLSASIRHTPLAEAVLRTVEQAALPRARIRLTITGGDLNLLSRRHESPEAQKRDTAPVDPTVLIVAQPATEYPPDMFDRGITAAIADLRINPLDPFAGHKSVNYWPRLRELQSAAARQAGEALIFQITNHLAGGCVSNAFLVKDGLLLTPVARGEEPGTPAPVLPGITRGSILDWARSRAISTARRALTIDDLLAADEAFLTNSSWGVLPVVRIEKHTIGPGNPGEITAAARSAWLAAVESASDGP